MAKKVKTRGWVYLQKRFGGSVQEPTVAQLSASLRELFDPKIDDEEHGAASLRFGNDEGPMFTIEFTCRHRARFEEWADQDYERELAPPRKGTVEGHDEALILWTALARGDLETVLRWLWESDGRQA